MFRNAIADCTSSPMEGAAPAADFEPVFAAALAFPIT
jgi:hypothetical protein